MESKTKSESLINNDFYEELNSNWYVAENHPVALLRAENKLRSVWVADVIAKRYPKQSVKILDIGCGAGFLTNPLAEKSHDVTGIDISESSLETARKYDVTGGVKYINANAYELPFSDGLFDVVFAMDVLEHVENPEKLIKEASRVLKPGGLFFFHTFNRNWLSYFIVIKGVEWFVKNTPPNLHVYPLFIKPSELQTLCESHRLKVEEMKGFMPKVWSLPFWKMLVTRKVSKKFSFIFTRSLATGYCGYAVLNP